MNIEEIQAKVSKIKIPYVKELHHFSEVPKKFIPWECGLSPSELYSRSLPIRKSNGIKALEVKYVSIKRWMSITPNGIVLPDGVFFSVKRKEHFVASPSPHFEKTEYILVMFKYGNVWSQSAPGVPITEEWLFSETEDGKLILEALMLKDASNPLKGFWKSVYNQYLVEKAKEDAGKSTLLWIHMKRKKAAETRQAAKAQNLNGIGS